jgi:ribonuclease HI
MKKNQNHKPATTVRTKIPLVRIFTDGSGARPDGKGSKFAWLCSDTPAMKVYHEDGLTNNQAEYHAILAALDDGCPRGWNVQIVNDSENTIFQLRGQRRVLEPKLLEIHRQIQALIGHKRLTVEFVWVPRSENAAGKLL